MAIEKGVYAAPTGLSELEEVVINIENQGNEEIIENADGSVEIVLIPGSESKPGQEIPFDGNLAEGMDEEERLSLATELLEDVDGDSGSRSEWAEIFVKGLDVLGLKYEERSEPWENACGVYSNVLSEAAIRFQAEAMGETFPAAGPVRTKILGEETKDKLEASHRVQADMNYELTERMVEYRPEHERLLYTLGLSGSAFKKVYFDPSKKRQVAIYIPAEDVIVPYGASHISMAERVTHIMRKTPNELKKLMWLGFYRDVEMDDPEPFHTDIEEKKAEEDGVTLNEDNRYAIYEIHVEMVIPGIDKAPEDSDDIDNTDIPKPYVVTIDKTSLEVLAIRRNWEEDDELYQKRDHFVHYCYIPGFGFYGLGLIHIVGGYARAGTSLIRQLVDAGTLSNLPGGLKSRGMRVAGDDAPVGPGEWKDVDVPSGTLRENIMALPYGEPSRTLLELLDKITNEGRRLGAIADMNVSDMSANAPVGTTLALLERTLKPMAAVQSRVHYAMKLEFKLLKDIMAENAPENYEYLPYRGEYSAKREDYSMVDVIPVSDPNSATMAQRVVQYQAVLQMSQQAPHIYDLPVLHQQMIEVIGIKNAEKLVPTLDDADPKDPVSENMDALRGSPMKAFIYQDHEAHIGNHMSFIQDPMVAAGIGQNPAAQQIMAALQAHIAEHIGFRYRKQIEDKLGAPLPPPGEKLDEQIEVNLARLVDTAGAQLTGEHKKQAAAQKAAEEQKDPMMQLKKQEQDTKAAEVARKARKDEADIQLAKDEQRRKAVMDEIQIQLDKEELEVDRQELKLKAAEIFEKMENEKEEFRANMLLEEIKIFVDKARKEPGN